MTNTRKTTIQRARDAITAANTIASLDAYQLAAAIGIAATDREASYMPGTPATGAGGSSDISDPTHTAATRTHPDLDLKALEHLATLPIAARELQSLALHGNRDPKSRPTGNKGPCLGGWEHHPTEDGNRCALNACSKPWPCHPGETESKFEECTGTIDVVTGKCRTCELDGDSMVCKDCNEVKPRSDARSHQCGSCRKAQQRAKAEVETMP